MGKKVDWGKRAQKGFLASGIDPADRKGLKNCYVDFLQKRALEEVLDLKGDEIVLDFGCGSGRISYWVAPRVKKVVGLEVTPEMIQLAEKNRQAENVEFILYDGLHFPVFSYPMDLVLSVGVLQIMKGDVLKRMVSQLTGCLKKGGKLCLIEQVSDDPRVGRPSLAEYIEAFKGSKLECLRYYPIRSGRWWTLYLIRYGLVPEGWFPRIAYYELKKRREQKGLAKPYRDFLFVLEK